MSIVCAQPPESFSDTNLSPAREHPARGRADGSHPLWGQGGGGGGARADRESGQ